MTILQEAKLSKEASSPRLDSLREFMPPGSLVMLYDHTAAGQELKPSWRGPFGISGMGGTHGRCYTIEHVDGKPISRRFHSDQLKAFELRASYLSAGDEERLPAGRDIRAGSSQHSFACTVELRDGFRGNFRSREQRL